MWRAVALMMATILWPLSNALAESETIFRGVPSLKISEGGLERVEEKLSREDSVNLTCVISKIDERFYWASRENKELYGYDGSVFVTFVSVDGAGYIRVTKSTAKETASLL